MILRVICGKIEEIKIKIMYYSGTPWAEKEKRFETLLILSKMLDDEMSENHMFSILPNKGGTHEINNHVSLNDISHEINRDLFYEILDELSSEGIISTLGFKSYSIKDINKLNQKIF